MDLEETELVNLNEFLQMRTALVRDDYFSRDKNVEELVKKDLDLPEEHAFDRLQEICNPELLNSNDAQGQITKLDDLDNNLEMIKYLKNIYANITKRIQPHEIKFVKNMTKLNELEPTEDDVISTPDIILTVQISHPLNVNLRKLAWSEEFLVLGQSFLTNLKDKIVCFRNEIKIGEFSENPDDVEKAPVIKDHIKSGYFFIENTIYNDLRNDNNDLSLPVLKWAQEKRIGEIQARSMENVKFVDLSIRLGFPYLFTHLGNCEHLIIFTSIKLVNPSSDCYLKSSYPIIKEKSRGRYTFCWCCNKIYAKWIITGSEYAVDDPTFLCERCLRNTHYLDAQRDETENRLIYKKVIDFKAYHYSQL